MAVPPAIRLDVRLVALVDDKVLLTRPAAELWHALPGGPVGAGEGAERALARHLDGLLVPAAGALAFAGAVEHTGDAGEAAAGPSAPDSPGADGAEPSWAHGTPGSEHVLTLLFAAEWPAGDEAPRAWRGQQVSLVGVDDLVVTRLAPLPVAWATRHWLANARPGWRRLAPAAAEAAWHGGRPPVAAVRAQLAARRDQLRGRRFRDAAVAMCALVAAADGRIDPAEREGLRAFLATDPVMAYFPTDELERVFEQRLAALAADFEAGKHDALGEIAKVRGRPAEATAVLRLGEVMGRIDGAFPPVEQEVLGEAAAVLGLDSAHSA
ncbi:TerB family tellurite resistance protein [Pseudofrankia inefficax]|uniref:Putative tellurium resistance protein n=1 Tax=Pseudofrankia inefficax (strain DSM 45817 / CECT 9037 / DDB 130130 / EuI1c) TaxID=298654 RepID=E3J341_PSEI1|nr:TerB family tellurite resistance protein [Pseudofrankia inefficax]ADP82991.1 putative tellurium resistance protein [Pseudofrankia inefficax]